MKKLFKSLFALAMLTLLFSFIALATSESGMKVFDKRTNIEPNKQWTIKLNMELDTNSIENNVYVIEKNGNKIDASINLGIDGKSIVVQAPKEGYKYDEIYTLQIKASSEGVKGKSGETLTQDVSMEFAIKTDPNAVTSEVRGNTSGNLNNSGKVIQIGDWIYFNGNIYNKEMDGFYKMKSDGTSKTLLAEGDPWYINIVGEWIYYYDLQDSIFYKMKTDGSNRSVFIKENGTLLKVVDGWAYYISLGYDTSEEVCRIKLDGTLKTSISKMRALGFDISNGYVYFSSFKENTLYKVKADGNELTTLTVEDRPNEIIASKDWVYYSANTSTDETKLYKVSPSGDNIIKLSDNNVYNINLIGDYLYFIRFDDAEDKRNLYKVKTDGTGEQEIDTTGIYYFYSVGDWIYCQAYGDNNFRIKSDGTGKQFINN